MIARRIIQAEDAPPVAVLVCAERLLGEHFWAYEPETIRYELEELGLDLPEINVEKILAMQALLAQESFFWDSDVFAQTCSVFNDLPTAEDTVPDLPPCVIAWGVEQALMVIQYKEPGAIPAELDRAELFDDGPEMYTAVCCVEYSLFVPPVELAFAREALKHIVPADEQLVSDVKKAYADIPKPADPDKIPLSETAVDVQIAQMLAVHLYCWDRRDELESLLRLLQAEKADTSSAASS